MNKSGMTELQYRCPKCKSIWSSSELLYSEGNCLTDPDECGWEDALEDIAQSGQVSTGEECKWCTKGDTPKLLDRHGVIAEKSDEPKIVTWCHAYDIYWWPCTLHSFDTEGGAE